MSQEERLATDILLRWRNNQRFSWENQTPSACQNPACREEPFATGDVLFVYGDPLVAIARKEYLCARCGLSAAYDNRMPAATLIYVEPDHRRRSFSELPEAVRARILESFEYVDAVHSEFEARLKEILDREEPN